ncbi:MAG: hypothetical protein PQJ50_18560 [Spirochaetales bacterium]|nr:hypothetical protein [Spirochaetales bacterium]
MRAEKQSVPKVIVFLLVFARLAAIHTAVTVYLKSSQFGRSLNLVREPEDGMIREVKDTEPEEIS